MNFSVTWQKRGVFVAAMIFFLGVGGGAHAQKLLTFDDVDVSVWQYRVNASGTGSGGARNLIDPDKTDTYAGYPLIRTDPKDPSTWNVAGYFWPSDFQGLNFALTNHPSCPLTDDPWFIWDLGSARNVEKMHIWNVSEATGWTRGLATFNLYYATSPVVSVPGTAKAGTMPGTPTNYDFQGGGWTQFGPTYTVDRGANGTDIDLEIDLTSVPSARYIGIEMKTNLGDSNGRAGLNAVVFTEVDTTPPTLAITDDDADDAMEVYSPITYTLTFNEMVDPATIIAANFSNVAGSPSSYQVDYINQIDGSTFDVVITPTTAGNLQLQVSTNVTDFYAGNQMAANVADAETITVNSDTAPPQVLSITDDRNSGPVAINTPITYTVTFNEYMNTNTVTVADFVNAAGSPAAMTVNSVTPTAVPSVFTVVVTPTGVGDILLRLPSGSVNDQTGFATASNYDDVETIAINNPGLVIYEPFEDSDATLDANTPGTGLSGTWSSNGGSVETNSLSHGELITMFNKALISNTYGGVSVGTTLSSLGLLNDGANLWFSVIVRTGGDVATNGDLGFALGTDRIGSGNNIPCPSGQEALGVRFKNNTIRACYWNNNPNSIAGSSCGPNTTYLIVGKYEWGATNDTITLYNVDTSLELGAAASTFSVSVDQSQYDTISFGSKAATPEHAFDEIRFGSTYESVIVLPPPSGTIIMVK